MKPTWSSMVPLKHGESMQQITRFLNSVSWLVALQIRRLLYAWMDEWLGLVKSYEVNYFPNTSVIVKKYLLLGRQQ